MVFSSALFLFVFLPLVLIGLFLLKRKWQKLFFAYNEPAFLYLWRGVFGSINDIEYFNKLPPRIYFKLFFLRTKKFCL